MDYIKAPKKVAEAVGQAQNRGLLPDGNYLLWERDLLPLHPYDLEAIGCVALSAAEVREEQGGGEPAPLPEITDERIAREGEES